MTVRELINELEGFPEEMEVAFMYDYGDRINTKIAKDVKHLEIRNVIYSPYHLKNKVVKIEDEDENNEEQQERLILV